MSRPWMPLYVADYAADTGHLSTLEHGAYMLLIMHYWSKGGLPSSSEKLARVARLPLDQWLEIEETISEFFDEDWRHGRIDAELAKAEDVSAKRKAAAERRYSTTPANADASAHANADQKQTQSQSQSQEDTSVSSKRTREAELRCEFDGVFWPEYPNKVGKPKALASFVAARRKHSLETIMAGLRAYIAGKPPNREWLNPTTFLNQERYNDQPAMAATVLPFAGHAPPVTNAPVSDDEILAFTLEFNKRQQAS
jgi:uncharacterized protein YdaU (DUF1376 family)